MAVSPINKVSEDTPPLTLDEGTPKDLKDTHKMLELTLEDVEKNEIDIKVELNKAITAINALVTEITGILKASDNIVWTGTHEFDNQVDFDSDVDFNSTAQFDDETTFTDVLKMSTGVIVEAEGAAVASATTPNIWSEDGNTIHITGTTTITGFAAAPQAGAWKRLIFDGAVTLTHGANLIVPGSANYTTAAGDIVLVYADTTTQFRLAIFKADGTAVSVTSVLPITRSDLSTSTGGWTGTLNAATEFEFAMAAYAFFPMWHSVAPGQNIVLTTHGTDGGSADAPRAAMYNTTSGKGATNYTYDIDYRYVLA